MEINFYTKPSLQYQAELFLRFYHLQNLIISPDYEPILNEESSRKCLFCHKKYPAVTFKHKAHTIPAFLGNKNHIHDGECDTCNNRFSVYESELKHFLGMLPTITKTKGRNGVPNFHSPNDLITVRKTNKPNFKGAIEIHKKDKESDAIHFDLSNGHTTISYKKHPYIPANVYKALLKIALSCLPKSELQNYTNTLKIFDETSDSPHNPFMNVLKTTINFKDRYIIPAGFLFKRNHIYHNALTHVFILVYQNTVLQMAIPAHFDDLCAKFYSDQILMPICPPLFTSEERKFSVEGTNCIDLSSYDKKYDDAERWNLIVDQHDFNKSIKYNPQSEEWNNSEFNSLDKIVGIILVPKGYTIPLDKDKKI